MAEPIGIASGLLALSVFAFKGCAALHSELESFQSHPRNVRDLEHEVTELRDVLASLNETVRETPSIDLSLLKLPLLRCGHACKEFGDELLKCSSHSAGGRKSFRDWAKLRYMGDNIDYFKQQLASYKSTITVALTNANLRVASITVDKFERYKDLVKETRDDLEAHLQHMDEKLEAIFEKKAADVNAIELRDIKEERLSTQRGLEICQSLSEHLDGLRLRPDGSSMDPESVPEKYINEGLQKCRISLDDATSKLEKHMESLVGQMMEKSKKSMSDDEKIEFTRLQEEWKASRQCFDICSKADYNLKENVTKIDNHADGDDTLQYLISTSQKTIHGKQRGYGFRIRQVGGHLSDDALKQISRDLSGISLPYSNPAHPAVQEVRPVESKVAEKRERSAGFERYGRGKKLQSEDDTPEPTKPSEGSSFGTPYRSFHGSS